MKPLSVGTAACLPLSLCLLAAAPTLAEPTQSATTDVLTVATFNASLNRDAPGQLLEDLATAGNAQASNVAETIQRVDPDIIVINEFDYDANSTAVDLFRTNYLEVPHNGAQPVSYPYSWAGSVNTGVPSGFDLDKDGTTSGPSDAWGFGKFPGQYGFVVYSKFPIKNDQVRSFQHFLWKDMPGALLPTNDDGTGWYSDEVLSSFPLSSKTHVDLPVDVDGTTIHVLAAHPTPPSFDGAEQRNKKRNFDEIRLWADYVSNQADYLYDDNGVQGGLSLESNFVILGDYNSDPLDGDSYPGAIDQLLTNSRVVDTAPTSLGGEREAELQGGANLTHRTEPKYDTADFNDTPRPGNLRVDYVLPNVGTQVEEAGVFWPTREDEAFRLTGLYPFPTSDHRLLWSKLRFPSSLAPADPSPSPSQGETPSPSPSSEEPRLANSGAHSGLLSGVIAAGAAGALLLAARRAHLRSRASCALGDA